MRSTRTFWGIAILLIGALLLLQNLGILDINVWTLLWPLLIILLGVQILLGIFLKPNVETRSLQIPLSGSTEASITFEHGAGRLNVTGCAATGNMLSGKFAGGVHDTVNQSGSMTQIKLRVPDDTFLLFWPVSGAYNRTWDVNLNPEIMLDLVIKTGASETNLDLSDLLVRSLRVDTGASATRITAPTHAGYSRFDLHSGAASLEITIPQGVAARIEIKGGISSSTIDRSRFPQNGNAYQSSDYASAANRLDILVETGVGSVDIR